VGVAVVAVDAPRLQHAIDVSVVARAPDVVHHLGAPIFLQGEAQARRHGGHDLVPAGALPLPAAARAAAFEGMQQALRIVGLRHRGRALGAIATTAARVMRVALETLDGTGLFVDEGEQTAGGLAVEAGGGDQRVVALDLAWPRLGVVLDPVVPLVRWWI